VARERLTKQDLRHDAFSEFVGKSYAFVQQRFLTILIVLGVAAVAVIGTIYMSQSGRRSSQQASQLMYQATNRYNLGAYGESLVLLDDVMARYAGKPEGRAAVYYAGACHLALGENDAAVERFREYLEKAPQGLFATSARSGLALALEARGDAVEAVETFRQLRQSLPQDDALYAQAAFGEARVLEGLGRFQEALDVLEDLLPGTDAQTRLEAESRIAVLKARIEAAS
jgi:tetratricopeptide (TPR) repeat protein